MHDICNTYEKQKSESNYFILYCGCWINKRVISLINYMETKPFDLENNILTKSQTENIYVGYTNT